MPKRARTADGKSVYARASFYIRTMLDQLDEKMHVSFRSPLTSDDVHAMSVAFETNTTITSLELGYCYLTANDCITLARALKTNTTVRLIYMAHNNIDNDGATALADVLTTNLTVELLDLRDCRISDAGACALADALTKNATIRKIDLMCNLIGNAGALALMKALETNLTVMNIDMYNNFISIADEYTINRLTLRNVGIELSRVLVLLARKDSSLFVLALDEYERIVRDVARLHIRAYARCNSSFTPVDEAAMQTIVTKRLADVRRQWPSLHQPLSNAAARRECAC